MQNSGKNFNKTQRSKNSESVDFNFINNKSIFPQSSITQNLHIFENFNKINNYSNNQSNNQKCSEIFTKLTNLKNRASKVLSTYAKIAEVVNK